MTKFLSSYCSLPTDSGLCLLNVRCRCITHATSLIWTEEGPPFSSRVPQPLLRWHPEPFFACDLQCCPTTALLHRLPTTQFPTQLSFMLLILALLAFAFRICCHLLSFRSKLSCTCLGFPVFSPFVFLTYCARIRVTLGN